MWHSASKWKDYSPIDLAISPSDNYIQAVKESINVLTNTDYVTWLSFRDVSQKVLSVSKFNDPFWNARDFNWLKLTIAFTRVFKFAIPAFDVLVRAWSLSGEPSKHPKEIADALEKVHRTAVSLDDAVQKLWKVATKKGIEPYP